MTTDHAPTGRIFQVVYISSAVSAFSAEELVGLLKKSRERNERQGVTGVLLYHDGNFMQLLEGSEQDVRATYARIQADQRHHGCLLLLERTVEGRLFPDWSMALKDSRSAVVRETPGFSDFLRRGGLQEMSKDAPAAMRLLETFRNKLR